MKNELSLIKAFAEWQMEQVDNGADSTTMIGFLFYDTYIVNPWVDETARFSVSKPWNYYGAKNYDEFLRKADEYLAKLQ